MRNCFTLFLLLYHRWEILWLWQSLTSPHHQEQAACPPHRYPSVFPLSPGPPPLFWWVWTDYTVIGGRTTIWHLATGDELCKPQKWAGKCGSSENDCPPNATSIYTLVRTFSWSSNPIYYDVCRSTAPKSPFQFWLPKLWIFDSSLRWPRKNHSHKKHFLFREESMSTWI